MNDASSPVAWQDGVFAALKKSAIRQVGYVPDAGHARLIERAHADPDMTAVVLTTEEEGIALAAGAYLGGQRAVLLMQSSGVGNCINMLSLPLNCRMPFLTLVTMRGEWGEFNPWQVPMGAATRPVLSAAGRACAPGRARRRGRRHGRRQRLACVRQCGAGGGAVLATADRRQGVREMSRTEPMATSIAAPPSPPCCVMPPTPGRPCWWSAASAPPRTTPVRPATGR